MMKKFDRGIRNQKFIDALNTLYVNKNSFWYKMVHDKELFIAIRKEYLNVYFRGQSICKLEFKKGIKGLTHKKYLGVDKPEYFSSLNGIVSNPESIIKSLADIDLIKENVKKHIGKEKDKSYLEIMSSEKCIIDVEVALVRCLVEQPVKKSEYEVSSIDYVAVETSDEELTLVFYEAKHYANSEIRSKKTPKVFGQITRYEAALNLHEEEIVKSYTLVIQNLRELHILSCGKLLNTILPVNRIRIDYKPRLIVFGVENVNKTNEHIEKLKSHFGNKLILKN
jgi:hypothetical protein